MFAMGGRGFRPVYFMEKMSLVYPLELHSRLFLPCLVLGSQMDLQGVVLGGEMGLQGFCLDCENLLCAFFVVS